MEMQDERLINADRSAVWAALLDPEALKQCVPGASEVTGTPEDGFEATVTQKVGPVKATFKGQVSLLDMTEPERLTLSGEGKGGAAGFAKGTAHVTLEEAEGGGTRLIYEVDAKVGGKLAQLGSRIVDGFAKKMADQFFGNLEAMFAEPEEEDGGEEGASEAAEKKGWLKRVMRKDA